MLLAKTCPIDEAIGPEACMQSPGSLYFLAFLPLEAGFAGEADAFFEG